ncbi:MAG TPA: F0F1 ATP synthase subunit gamma [Acetobacteraceae bacterium]|nr:F0F1 ATP synthase subunit gamma [Acetobacteraceae bacterium]
MASLKDLRLRINSVKSTRKITSAMKMVAASKLRRAQNLAEAARPYAGRMEDMLCRLAANVADQPGAPRLLAGTGNDKVHLLVPVTADRGLCGAFNSNIGRTTRALARKLEAEGKTVKILPVGRKGRDFLRREFPNQIIGEYSLAAYRKIEFAHAVEFSARIIELLDSGTFDVCTLVYNRFVNAMSQVPTEQQLIPLPVPKTHEHEGEAHALYEFEPDEESILTRLVPQNLAVQIFRALLESGAGEQGARMTAMDSATRNAGDMINRLTLNYNRTRQANITRELIEIISGAEAV